MALPGGLRPEQRAEAKGLCIHCKKRKSQPGLKRCEVCGEIRNSRQRAIRAKRKAEGQCYACNQPAIPGKTLCAKHAAIGKNRPRPPASCPHCGISADHPRIQGMNSHIAYCPHNPNNGELRELVVARGREVFSRPEVKAQNADRLRVVMLHLLDKDKFIYRATAICGGVVWNKFGLTIDPYTRDKTLERDCGIPLRIEDCEIVKHTGIAEMAMHVWSGLIVDDEGNPLDLYLSFEDTLLVITAFYCTGRFRYLWGGSGRRERTDELTPGQAKDIFQRAVEFSAWLGDACPLAGLDALVAQPTQQPQRP